MNGLFITPIADNHWSWKRWRLKIRYIENRIAENGVTMET